MNRDSKRLARLHEIVKESLSGLDGTWVADSEGRYTWNSKGQKIFIFLADEDLVCTLRMVAPLPFTVEMTAELGAWLLRRQKREYFGRFFLVEEDSSLAIEHVLVGDYLQMIELATILAVLHGFAEKCANEIRQMSGSP
jgi:hypothetical protein